ncbi:SDR family NAD(P)-dependent oxidoreductase [Shouchella patagoniensis]|uniref:SDR family NAD(P)-dependent oxidoreductase n=1 Tax=Shouchella patagoniensis TaxID=228576 RepID=UPI0034621ADF
MAKEKELPNTSHLGAKIAIGARSLEEAKQVALEIGEDHALPVKLDVTQEREWELAVQSLVAKYNQLDVLMNNAGVLIRNSLMDTTIEEYQQQINVNQLNVFQGIKAVVPQMEKQQKGSIINNVSVSSFAPIRYSSAYASTKAAVVALSKSAEIELGPKGIRVNMIHPGGIETQMLEDDRTSHSFYQSIPLGRVGQPIDIARAAAFLASDESSYCTGAEIVVDGGMTLGTNDQ